MSAPDTDQEVLERARACLADAQQRGAHFYQLPVWLLAALLEKAERPHD